MLSFGLVLELPIFGLLAPGLWACSGHTGVGAPTEEATLLNREPGDKDRKGLIPPCLWRHCLQWPNFLLTAPNLPLHYLSTTPNWTRSPPYIPAFEGDSEVNTISTHAKLYNFMSAVNLHESVVSPQFSSCSRVPHFLSFTFKFFFHPTCVLLAFISITVLLYFKNIFVFQMTLKLPLWYLDSLWIFECTSFTASADSSVPLISELMRCSLSHCSPGGVLLRKRPALGCESRQNASFSWESLSFSFPQQFFLCFYTKYSQFFSADLSFFRTLENVFI